LPPLRLFDFRLDDPFRDDFREGTFAPFFRASLRPIAIACLRLFTVRPEPLFSEPRFRRRIADSTLFDAFLPYLAMVEFLMLLVTYDVPRAACRVRRAARATCDVLRATDNRHG
jgi:hypothetical protein